MCISPSYVWVKRGPKWEQVPAPCDKCKLCKENYISDWVGRCLCEASTSQISCTVSLTYAEPDDWRELSHKVVTPLHFQLFMKRMRRAGHKIRYLAAGEYGKTYDRSHFHAILFFTDLRPEPNGKTPRLERAKHRTDPDSCARFCREIPQKAMVNIAEWPHGHIVVDWSMTEKAVRYACKYINPEDKKNAWFSPSKKPPLGAAWFAEKAAKSVDLDVLPSSFEYMPPGGKPGKKYLMTGATRRDYLNAITAAREKRAQMSEWVAKTFDKLERNEFKKASDVPIQWPDEYFADREKETLRIMAATQRKEDDARLRSEYIEAHDIQSVIVFTSARVKPHTNNGRKVRHVYQDEAEYEAACCCAARQSEGSPELFPERGSKARARKRAKAAAVSVRPATGFDRQGKPYWGDPKAQYLADAFQRPRTDGASDDPEGLSPPAASLE